LTHLSLIGCHLLTSSKFWNCLCVASCPFSNITSKPLYGHLQTGSFQKIVQMWPGIALLKLEVSVLCINKCCVKLYE
jgi:hypothetical protein